MYKICAVLLTLVNEHNRAHLATLFKELMI